MFIITYENRMNVLVNVLLCSQSGRIRHLESSSMLVLKHHHHIGQSMHMLTSKS